MIVENVEDFNKLVLQCGLREKAQGHLREILDCVMFFSTMCGCNAEAKEEKYEECDMRYRNFVKYSLDTIKSEILVYVESVTFNYKGEGIACISR